MISNPFFLLSIVFSSFFAFFTMAYIVELSIKIFRLKQYRIRSMLRLFPFFSLVVDLLFNQYSIAYWLNPLNCASCVQKLFLGMFFPELKAYLLQNQISLMNHLSFAHHHIFFAGVFIVVGGASLFFVLKKLVQAFFLMRLLHATTQRSVFYKASIASIHLKGQLLKHKTSIYLSDEIQIPLTVYPNSIIIPKKTIEILSQEEIEAVIAHELEHIRYQDSLSRLLYHLVAALFFWVPTHSWIKKMEYEQELACDQNILRYDLTKDVIASALFKVAKDVKVQIPVCCFTSSRNSTLGRIQDILGLSVENTRQTSIFGLNFLGVVCGVVFLFVCMMYF